MGNVDVQTIGKSEGSNDEPRDRMDVRLVIKALLPLIVGLAFGRAGLIAACYGSYENTDEGLFTDGAMLISLAVLLAPFFMITRSKERLTKSWVNRIVHGCIVVEIASIVAIAVVNIVNPLDFPLRFALSVVCTLSASGSMFYWLRRARGTSAAVAAIFVFSALILSEVELFIAAYLPQGIDCLFTAALAALQIPCISKARKMENPQELDRDATPADRYYGSTESILKNRELLIVLAVAVGTLSIVAGFLRGYPDGASIPFSTPTRIGYAVITIATCAVIITRMTHGKTRVMSQGVFITIELLACAALVCYAAFPGSLDIGAMFITCLNALMVGFSWYIIIGFMTYGWRDPYYYAMAGWFVWLGARSCARMSLLAVQPLSANDPLFFALMGTLLVVSCQVMFAQFARLERDEEKPAQEKPKTIVRIMGLDESESLADMQRTAMRHSAEIIGEQFLLSEREVDVLALYALGFTQKRVAEELYITQSTAHAHIKRIYAKTGMHSRQDIIDYINEYAS